jgi:hypothetical protein
LVATDHDTDHHQQIVNEVLHLLVCKSYFLCLAKCLFKQNSIMYLGIIVENDTIKPNPKKTNALRDWPCHLSTV